jgi:hypothetical protein
MSAVDVAGARWRKSSFSGGDHADTCVEVALVGSGAALRDSKNSDGPALVVPAAGWRALLTTTKWA